jgi:ketosteroid isomerase-like protein
VATGDTRSIETQDNAELVRAVYGFNWAAVAERKEGLAASATLLAADAEARVSSDVGERTLRGVDGFAVFVLGLEQDFSEFRYEAEDFAEPAADRVVVTGTIRARGRASKMPLSAPFAHIWTMNGGRAVSVVSQ